MTTPQSSPPTALDQALEDALQTPGDAPAADSLRPLHEIRPPEIFRELNQGVLGQDRALRFVSVAIYKHTTGRVVGQHPPGRQLGHRQDDDHEQHPAAVRHGARVPAVPRADDHERQPAGRQRPHRVPARPAVLERRAAGTAAPGRAAERGGAQGDDGAGDGVHRRDRQDVVRPGRQAEPARRGAAARSPDPDGGRDGPLPHARVGERAGSARSAWRSTRRT